MADPQAEAPPQDSPVLRAILGLTCVLAGFAALAGLYFVKVPEGNKDPLMLAIGIVLGWGSAAVGYEFFSSPSGRKLAEAAIRQVDS